MMSILPVFWLCVLVSQCVSVEISCTGDILNDLYIITFLPNTTTEQITYIIDHTTGTQPIQTFNSVNAVLIRLTEDKKLKDLSVEPLVVYIQCDSKVYGDGKIGRWGLDRIISNRYLPNDGVDSLFYPSGRGVHVFVLDSGINPNHIEFYDDKGKSRIQDKYSTSFVGQSWEDENGHGTHMAGIVAGRQYGVAKTALIHVVRVLDDKGAGSLSNVIAAIDYVVGLKRKNQDWDIVVLMALGGEKSYCENEAIQNAVQSSIHFAVSAGNDGTEISCNKSPSSLGGPNGPALTAIAYTQSDTRYSLSNWGNCTDIAAPGDSIYSASINSNRDVTPSSGTSVAAAHVAGVMALILERNSGISPSNLKQKLLKMATPINPVSSESPQALLYADFQIEACSAGSPCCNTPFWAPDGQTCESRGLSSTCLNGICVDVPVVSVSLISSIVEGESTVFNNPPTTPNPLSPYSPLLLHVMMGVGTLIVVLLLLCFALFLHQKCGSENKSTRERPSGYFPSADSERTITSEEEALGQGIKLNRTQTKKGPKPETPMSPENFGMKIFQGKHTSGKQIMDMINADLEVQGEPHPSDISKQMGEDDHPSETEDVVTYDPSPSAQRLGMKIQHPVKTPHTSKKIPQTFMSMLSNLTGGDEGPRSLTKKRSGNREVYSTLRTEEKQDLLEMANKDLGVAGRPMEDDDELGVITSDVADDAGEVHFTGVRRDVRNPEFPISMVSLEDDE